MEMTGVIKGLQQVPAECRVKVFSDSQYVVNTMTQGWRRNANQDLWAQLDPLVQGRRVTWEWVRGHNGHPLNETVDRLAVEATHDPTWDERSGDFDPGRGRTPPVPLTPQPSPATESRILSHVDAEGRARMVDVSPKDDTERVAIATGRIVMQPATLDLIRQNAIEKADVLTVAQIAGIMAAKRTSDLIPMCHPLMLSHVSVDLNPTPSSTRSSSPRRSARRARRASRWWPSPP